MGDTEFSYTHSQLGELSVPGELLMPKDGIHKVVVAMQPAIGSTLEISGSAAELKKIMSQFQIPLFMTNVLGKGDRSDQQFSFEAQVEDIGAIYEYLKNRFEKVLRATNSLSSPATLKAYSQYFSQQDGLSLTAPIVHPGDFISSLASKAQSSEHAVIRWFLEMNSLNANPDILIREIDTDRRNINLTVLEQLKKEGLLIPENFLLFRNEYDKISTSEQVADLPASGGTTFEGTGKSPQADNHPLSETNLELSIRKIMELAFVLSQK